MELSTEKSSQIFAGGGGGSVGRSKLWEHPPHRKSENGKKAKSPLSATKKKTIDLLFAIVPTYHAHKDKDNRENRANG